MTRRLGYRIYKIDTSRRFWKESFFKKELAENPKKSAVALDTSVEACYTILCGLVSPRSQALGQCLMCLAGTHRLGESLCAEQRQSLGPQQTSGQQLPPPDA
jgi:hypothetical protein